MSERSDLWKTGGSRGRPIVSAMILFLSCTPSVALSGDRSPPEAASATGRLHVANNAALAALATIEPVEKDGYQRPGDGGGARYTYSRVACGTGANPPPDGGTCIDSTAAGFSGAWLIDWSSLNNEVTPQLFGATFKAAADQKVADRVGDTNAFNVALSTGRTVRYSLGGGSFFPSGPLNVKTRGQTVRCRDGRTACTMTVDARFAPGVFNIVAPDTTLDGVSINFVQKDSARLAEMLRFQPAVFAENQPATKVLNGRFTNCWTCLDMANGNSGNSRVENNEMSGYDILTIYDGALDIVRDRGNHRWPFSMTPQQLKIMLDHATGIQAGRVDGLLVSDDMFITQVGISLATGHHASSPGCTFGTVSGSEFDGHTGIVGSCGNLSSSSNIYTVGNNVSAVHASGTFSFTASASSWFMGGASGPITAPAVVVADQADVAIGSSKFEDAGNDAALIFVLLRGKQVGLKMAHLTLTGNIFTRNPGLPYTAPIVDAQGGGVLTALGNSTNTTTIPTNICFKVGVDGAANRVVANSCPGGRNLFPPNRASPSSYQLN